MAGSAVELRAVDEWDEEIKIIFSIIFIIYREMINTVLRMLHKSDRHARLWLFSGKKPVEKTTVLALLIFEVFLCKFNIQNDLKMKFFVRKHVAFRPKIYRVSQI